MELDGGFILELNKDGEFEEYKEPFAVIECKTFDIKAWQPLPMPYKSE